ncbi:MAG TPA: site-specific DNA-methyltransferase [Syntrophomonadaceae bacterium]|nr:site-specific DNA-methyltransferase [Syntrophomonadaceae bacterium]
MKKRGSVTLDWETKNQNYDLSSSNNIVEIEQVYPFVYHGDIISINDIPDSKLESLNGRLIKGDNQNIMANLLHNNYKDAFDLIYLDPPYFSDINYKSKINVGDKDKPEIINRNVFDDKWKNLDDYLDYIFPILKLSRDLLSEQGSLLVHVDWHASHYIKILLDEIFSKDRFINEIIWCYGGGSGAKRHFHRKHDTILWYSKTNKYIFNPQYRPYTEKTLNRGLTKVKGSKYVLNKKGALMQDWWIDINKILSPTAYENLKFPTQKPIALLERIIKASSNENSLVGDFFAGSGTTAEAAEKLGRSWVVCDQSSIAIQTTHNRLINCNAKPFTIESLDVQSNKLTDIDIVCNYMDGILTINLLTKPGTTSKLIDFWEIGISDKNVFKSLIQVTRPNNKTYDLPDKVRLTGIDQVWRENLVVRVYDFVGNVFTKAKPF